MQDSRTNQGGSVLTFVIVGVVLAGLVVGGVFLMRQRGEQARTSGPTVAQTDTSKQGQEQKPAETKPEGEKKPEQNPTPSQTKPEDKKEEKPANQPTPATPRPESAPTSGDQQIPTTGQSTAPAANPQEGTRPNVATGAPVDHSAALPTTGPFDTAFQLLALGALTAAAVAYVRSRLQNTPQSPSL